jgi:hypothetical protein
MCVRVRACASCAWARTHELHTEIKAMLDADIGSGLLSSGRLFGGSLDSSCAYTSASRSEVITISHTHTHTQDDTTPGRMSLCNAHRNPPAPRLAPPLSQLRGLLLRRPRHSGCTCAAANATASVSIPLGPLPEVMENLCQVPFPLNPLSGAILPHGTSQASRRKRPFRLSLRPETTNKCSVSKPSLLV